VSDTTGIKLTEQNMAIICYRYIEITFEFIFLGGMNSAGHGKTLGLNFFRIEVTVLYSIARDHYTLGYFLYVYFKEHFQS